MEKLKRIAALCGVILLIVLYVLTLVFAMMGRDWMNALKVAIVLSVIVPVFIWIVGYIAKLLDKYFSPEARKKTSDYYNDIREYEEKQKAAAEASEADEASGGGEISGDDEASEDSDSSGADGTTEVGDTSGADGAGGQP